MRSLASNFCFQIGQLIDLIGAKEADVSDVSIKPYDPENFKDPEDPEGRGEETLPNEGQLQVSEIFFYFLSMVFNSYLFL